jgi:putative transposase
MIDPPFQSTHSNSATSCRTKTLKYRPDFPGRFTSIEAARAHCQRFFTWYNQQHRSLGVAAAVA